MANEKAKGVRVRGADGNLYLVTGMDVETTAVAHQQQVGSIDVPLISLRGEMQPVGLCIIVSDDDNDLPSTPTSAVANRTAPTALCIIVTDDGVELPETPPSAISSQIAPTALCIIVSDDESDFTERAA